MGAYNTKFDTQSKISNKKAKSCRIIEFDDWEEETTNDLKHSSKLL
jgi:hypothetical protein